jgi:hypothetical protein
MDKLNVRMAVLTPQHLRVRTVCLSGERPPNLKDLKKEGQDPD